MLRSFTFNLIIKDAEYKIFISPFSLHSREETSIKSGSITQLFFYIDMKDDHYKKMIQQDEILRNFESDDYILNFGQDFEKYYLGSSDVDFNNNALNNWNGGSNSKKLSEKDIMKLSEVLFNHSTEHEPIILFTPTKPSDINLKRKR